MTHEAIHSVRQLGGQAEVNDFGFFILPGTSL